ncbi:MULTISPECIES: hypothetical protein [unclassified Mesotoga]|uniref:hypothetical protein n=1 Tax=unclassified Mesotoga TaxID=1184398 RepID=UPI000DA67414|nr:MULTISPECIES: hypothetical protein [unclassified Mesotoga]PZC51850.1 hypothetical protein LH53_08740 [Mesotoga sp. TolDC]
MAGVTSLRMYGENSATFLLFQALSQCPKGIEELFLNNLKAFGTGRRTEKKSFENVEVWLFPNFGRGIGFGEPDALILADGLVFWVEVETTINCKTRSAALKRSLRQMWRFHLFQLAVNKGIKIRDGSKVLMGSTLSDDNSLRDAKVKIRDHGVLRKDLPNRLKKAGENLHDHYVLLTVDKPVGGGEGYEKELCNELSNLEKEVSSNLSHPLDSETRLPVDRCWYLYWKGDIERKYNQQGCHAFKLEDIYVRIK